MKFKFGSCLFIFVLLLSFEASASHYDLVDVPLFGEKDIAALQKAGIPDTQILLDKTTTPDLRKALAAKTGIPLAQIEVYSKYCDLLRINGVGPSMAALLTLCDFPTIEALRRADPAQLAVRMSEVNDAKGVAGSVPDEPILTGWINQAKELPIVLK